METSTQWVGSPGLGQHGISANLDFLLFNVFSFSVVLFNGVQATSSVLCRW